MKLSQEQWRNLLSLFFSFLLSLLLAAITLLTMARFLWLNDSFLYKAMDKAGYYTLVEEHLYDVAEARSTPFGLPEETLEGLFSKEQIRLEVTQQLQARLAATTVEVDTEALEQDLDLRLRTYLKDQNIPIFDAHEDSMEELVKMVVTEYRKNMALPIAGAYLWAQNVMNRIYFPVMMVLVALAGGAGVLLRSIQSVGKRTVYLRYALVGAGWMMMALPIVLLLGQVLKRLQLAPEHLYALVSIGGEQMLWQMVIAGVGLSVIGGAMLVWNLRQDGASQLTGTEHK